MAEKWTVQEVRARQVDGTPCWQVRVLRADGQPHVHVMPQDVLEWRAAEYGIDPTDTDTLLEIVLHEPHMALTEETEDEPARYAAGPALWEADSTATARTAHLDRVKACPVRITVRGQAALAPVRAGHKPDLQRVRAMREAVDTQRWAALYGGLPVQPITAEEALRA
ncbi:hypothetical protein [Streptomyces sp. NPDC002088]|uniref:hypothetical protein n=1 Tax=Streptomyces sp. NPDC002088 TaxID=3154665 RepID=UPI00332C484A